MQGSNLVFIVLPIVISVPEQLPRVLEIAMRAALQRGGIAVVVVPGEVFLADAPHDAQPTRVRRAWPVVRPDDESLAAAAQVLNAASRVTILAGAGCAGAHDQLIALAAALKAPVVHAFRGKEFVEYDNPYDVGMTGLIGYTSGYRAMEHCDALVMPGTNWTSNYSTVAVAGGVLYRISRASTRTTPCRRCPPGSPSSQAHPRLWLGGKQTADCSLSGWDSWADRRGLARSGRWP